MNYRNFSNTESLYKINPNNSNYLTEYPINDKVPISKTKLMLKIIEFSKSLKLWNDLKTPENNNGFNDIDLTDNIIKYDRWPFGKTCIIKFGLIKDDFRGQTKLNEIDKKPEFIVLSSNTKYQSDTVPTWSQVLIMELGNFKNRKKFKCIDPKKIDRESYIRQYEQLEFDVRIQIIEAYNNKQFDSAKYKKQDCIFPGKIVDFETYYNAPESQEHKKIYGIEWDKNHK